MNGVMGTIELKKGGGAYECICFWWSGQFLPWAFVSNKSNKYYNYNANGTNVKGKVSIHPPYSISSKFMY